MNLDALIGQWNSLDDLLFRTFFAKTRQTITDIMLTLTSCTGDNLVQLTIAGNSEQDGTPTPENPIPITNVGTLISEGEHAGKYAVKVEVSDSEEEPTQTVTKTIYLDEPLRKGDTLEVVDGKLVKRRGRKAFDGTESIAVRSTNVEGIFRYGVVLPNCKSGATTEKTVICTHYLSKNNSETYKCNNGVSPYNDDGKIIIFDEKLQSEPALKNYLASQYVAGTPVTVEYDLATPIEIDISGQDIPTFSGTTIIRVNSVIQPESMTATYWQEG